MYKMNLIIYNQNYSKHYFQKQKVVSKLYEAPITRTNLNKTYLKTYNAI